MVELITSLAFCLSRTLCAFHPFCCRRWEGATHVEQLPKTLACSTLANWSTPSLLSKRQHHQHQLLPKQQEQHTEDQQNQH